MPLTTSNPEIIDGITYPYLSLSMAMAPEWREQGMGAQVACEFIPYRVTETGQVEKAVRDGRPVSRSLAFGDAFGQAASDSDLGAAVEGILSAVQGYLTARGL